MKEQDPKLAVRLSADDVKAVKMFCLEHDTTVQAFLEHAIRHCMDKKIIPGKSK